MTARFRVEDLEGLCKRAAWSWDQWALAARVHRRTFDRIRNEGNQPRGDTLERLVSALKRKDPKEFADLSVGHLWDHAAGAAVGPRPPADTPDAPSGAGSAADPDNPFLPWAPAVPPAFVGRTGLLRELERAALEGVGLSLVGERRMGKTSLLCTWAGRAVELGFSVRLLSGQGPERLGHREFTAAVIVAPAVEAGAGSGRADAEPTAVPESPDGAADRLADWCRGTRAASGGRRPILLLDETDAFLVRCERDFLVRLRGLLTKRELCLAVATGRTLPALYAEQGRTSPFANALQLRRVALLDEASARRLIARGADRWQGDDPDWLLDWAGTQAFYLSLLARGLYDARGDGEPRERVLDHFRDEAVNQQFAPWWAALDEGARTALRRAAAGESVDGAEWRERGLLTQDNRPFARVLTQWLNETR